MMYRVAWILLIALTATSVARASDAPLADAAQRRDWKAVETLLAAAADLDARQVDGMTALHWSAFHDHAASVDRLLEAGADARISNRYGVTPLALACTNGNGRIVELLLRAGADPNAALRGGETALMTAARTGKLAPVRALLKHGAEVQAKLPNGQTAVMWAAADGNVAVGGAALAAGADTRTPLASGFTPLFFAVREGRSEVVRYLLQTGDDVNAVMQPKSTNARSPRRGTSPLMLAVENGHFELALLLLDAGADPNDQRSGFTPLHAITWVRKPNRGDGVDGDPAPIGSGSVNSLQFVRELVKHGADVNARLIQGRSLADVARRTRRRSPAAECGQLPAPAGRRRYRDVGSGRGSRDRS